MDGVGGKGVRAIQGHQELPPAGPETVAQGVLSKTRKALNKDRVEMARGDRIEEGADVIVAGDLRDAKQSAGVIAALVYLELALILQKRGRWSKEDILHAALDETFLFAFFTTGNRQIFDASPST